MRFRDNTLYSRLSKASVFPVPERLLGAMKQDFVKGGKYLNNTTREDMTGRTLSGGSIRVGGGDPHPTRGSKVTFHTSDRDATPATTADGGRVRVNLFKQKAGWKWNGDSANRKEATVVSVEHKGKHTYALSAHFAHPFTLARYADAPSEPRLRPTTRGVVDAGPVAGHISVRGRLHPVHEHVVIRSGKPDGAIRYPDGYKAKQDESKMAKSIASPSRAAANTYRDGLRSDAHRTFATHVIRNIFGEGGRIPHHKDIRGNEQEQLLNATQASRITKRMREIERGAYRENTDIAKGIDKIGGASNSAFDFDTPVTPKAPRTATPRKVTPTAGTKKTVLPSPDMVLGVHHAEAMRLIHAHEALHHESREEHALIVSPHTGKKVWGSSDGSEDSVHIPPEVINDVRKNHPGAYFTHNHPSGWNYPQGHIMHVSSSLSPDDVNMAAKLRVGQMRASSPTHVYIARPPTGGWTNGERHMEPGEFHPIGMHCHRADREVRQTIGEEINNGETSYDQANAKHYHEVLTKMHNRGILNYERVEKGKEKT